MGSSPNNIERHFSAYRSDSCMKYRIPKTKMLAAMMMTVEVRKHFLQWHPGSSEVVMALIDSYKIEVKEEILLGNLKYIVKGLMIHIRHHDFSPFLCVPASRQLLISFDKF